MAAVISTATKRLGIVQQRIDGINSTLQENVIGQRVVKAFVRADFERQKCQQPNDALTHAFVRAVSIAILNMPLMMLVMNGTTRLAGATNLTPTRGEIMCQTGNRFSRRIP